METILIAQSKEEIPLFADIIRSHTCEELSCVSGYYDPIHVGHLENMVGAADLGALVVIVNGDKAAQAKKGKSFMPLEDRIKIVAAIRYVSLVVPWDESTVDGALELIKPRWFCKGKDRYDPTTIPEWDLCQKLGIEIKCGIGNNTIRNSSDFLERWKKS